MKEGIYFSIDSAIQGRERGKRKRGVREQTKEEQKKKKEKNKKGGKTEKKEKISKAYNGKVFLIKCITQ